MSPLYNDHINQQQRDNNMSIQVTEIEVGLAGLNGVRIQMDDIEGGMETISEILDDKMGQGFVTGDDSIVFQTDLATTQEMIVEIQSIYEEYLAG